VLILWDLDSNLKYLQDGIKSAEKYGELVVLWLGRLSCENTYFADSAGTPGPIKGKIFE